MSQFFSDDNSAELISPKGTIKVYKNLNVLITPSQISNVNCLIYGWRFFNSASVIRFVKLYDKATAPIIGTDIAKITLPVANDVGSPFAFLLGIPFNNGLWIAVTQNASDTDTSAVPGSNQIMAHILYANG